MNLPRLGAIAAITVLVVVTSPLHQSTTMVLAAAPSPCSAGLAQREPLQVVQEFYAALAARDWTAVRCNIDDDAVLISDNGVSNGAEAIVTEFQAIDGFFGGSFVQISQQIPTSILGGNRSMVRILYTVDTGCGDIPDGVDTFVIKGGVIAALTTHGFILFSC
jgi:hypothetical protein